ncbi:g11882 [Coccomyxa viridis]|uniref:G11882 protein n=1 Tax=Coccomyxa viridis TaxID=1274662 RepID=A0ABP1G9C6_9CHLO
MPLKLFRNDTRDSSPVQPSTPPRSSSLKNPLRRSHSFLLRDSVKGTFMSRGSQPNLVSYADDEADHASSSRDENRKKGGHMRNGKAWWRQRPQVLAMVAIALLGSAGLASTWSGPLRRGSAGKHKHLMSHGVPESLMHANITAGYADTFCKSFVPSNLTTQHWVDEPMCQRANTTFKAGVHQKDACAAVINVPKIAMLFLATKGFPHAAMWSMWFQQVRGLVPRDCVAQAFCQRGRTRGDPAGFNELIQACGPSSETPGMKGIVEEQHLFNLYVHLPPNKTLEGPPTIFNGHEIPGSIQTGWGEWSLADASRVLIREALKNPLNQRFIMLSESCVPLYPPAVVYQQLMWEKKSRINACDSDPNYYRDNYRYTWRMAPELEESKWRKSFQWFGVVRKHAKVIAEDTKIAKVFEKHCVNAWDDDRNAWRSCFSDEHYFATVLATQGVDEETDCTGGMTHTEWCNPCLTPDDRLHPTAYTADMVSQESMANMREVGLKMCNVSAAEDLAAVSFVSAAQLAAGQQCGQAPPPSMEGGALGRGCPVFARKFPSDTAHKVLEASFNMLVSENKVAPQGYLVPDSKAPGFDKQCKSLGQPAKSRKQLFV